MVSVLRWPFEIIPRSEVATIQGVPQTRLCRLTLLVDKHCLMLCCNLVDGAFFQQHRENLFTHRLGENQFGEAPPGFLPVSGTKNDERTTIFQARVKYLLPF